MCQLYSKEEKKKKKGMYFTGTLLAVKGSARKIGSDDSRK